MKRARKLAALTLLLAVSAATAARASADGPLLRVEAPAELAAAAARIRTVPAARLAGIQRLVGLERSGAPIRVILAAERDAAAAVPDWISGYAYGELGVIVLLPERQPSYPDSSLEELLRHEVAHVLLHRAAAGHEVPRWFNEGVAMLAGGAWDLEDRSRLTLALVLKERSPLDRLDRSFSGSRGEVARAYTLSGALVREMFRRFGRDVAADLLRRIAVGVAFEEAFRRTTGLPLARFERDFWRRHSVWYRWVPVLTSSLTLWLGITALALWAGRVRRRRRAELERKWDEEEAALRQPPGQHTSGTIH